MFAVVLAVPLLILEKSTYSKGQKNEPSKASIPWVKSCKYSFNLSSYKCNYVYGYNFLKKVMRTREFEVFSSGAIMGIGLGILAVYHKTVSSSSSPYDVKMSQNLDNVSTSLGKVLGHPVSKCCDELIVDHVCLEKIAESVTINQVD